MANVLSDQEEFNTRYGSLNGWQEAVRKIKPIPRAPAQFSLTDMVFAGRRRPRPTRSICCCGAFSPCRSTTKRAPP